jgi:hypothetical protein
MPQDLPDPLPSAPFTRYSQPRNRFENAHPLTSLHWESRKPAPRLPSARNCSSTCTKSGHPPVDALHSIENKSDKVAQFSLTPEIEGVQTESFFDSFLSFSGWCGVRGSSSVTLNIAK